jgi:hypothetical protein
VLGTSLIIILVGALPDDDSDDDSDKDDGPNLDEFKMGNILAVDHEGPLTRSALGYRAAPAPKSYFFDSIVWCPIGHLDLPSEYNKEVDKRFAPNRREQPIDLLRWPDGEIPDHIRIADKVRTNKIQKMMDKRIAELKELKARQARSQARSDAAKKAAATRREKKLRARAAREPEDRSGSSKGKERAVEVEDDSDAEVEFEEFIDEDDEIL